MAELTFENLSFQERDDSIRVNLLQIFYCDIPKNELEQFGRIEVEPHTLRFLDADERVERKFGLLLSKHITHLTHRVSKNPATYVHRNSGIPLMGTRFFGIQDRGTDILEIKPITGCNVGCTFCSVDEGIGTKKKHDIVVEADYLLEETRQLLDYKQHRPMTAYINVHGEPLLYGDLVHLIRGLSSFDEIEDIVIITNGVLLTPKLIDELSEAGLTRINCSISASDPDEAKRIMNYQGYNLERVKEMVTLAAKKMRVSVTPVWVDGVNDEAIEETVKWGKENGIEVYIQKFCFNKGGRNPIKEISWEKFFDKLSKLEKRYDIKLQEELYKLAETKELPVPFKRGDVVKAEIKCQGRYPNERVCVAKNRCIVVTNTQKDSGTVKVEIQRSKHNIFTGKVV